MRFSLKWLLAGMVYAAIVAAAFARPHWAYAVILWTLTFFSLVYAATAAVFSRGRRQSVAVGFAFAIVSLILCLHFAPDSLPTGRLIVAAFPGQSTSPVAYGTIVAPTQTPTTVYPMPTLRAPIAGGWRTGGSGGYYSPPVVLNSVPFVHLEEVSVRHSAANAVATMLAGLIGCLLGALAYRRGRTEGE